MLTAKLFHQWPPLFELTQRSCMEPHILRLRIHLLFQDAESLSLASPHLAHLLVEATIDRHSQEVEIYDDVIHLNIYDLRIYDLLAQHLNSALGATDGLFLAKEGRDVEHARTLALTYESQTPGVHDVAQFIFLLLYPSMHNLLLIL